jgi:hypothetical protein
MDAWFPSSFIRLRVASITSPIAGGVPALVIEFPQFDIL